MLHRGFQRDTYFLQKDEWNRSSDKRDGRVWECLKTSLHDFLLTGDGWMWENGRSDMAHVRERLTYVIVNEEWADLINHFEAVPLGYFGSDQRAIQILLDQKTVPMARRPSQFRLESWCSRRKNVDMLSMRIVEWVLSWNLLSTLFSDFSHALNHLVDGA